MSGREALLRGYKRGLGAKPRKPKKKKAQLTQAEILRLKALARKSGDKYGL